MPECAFRYYDLLSAVRIRKDEYTKMEAFEQARLVDKFLQNIYGSSISTNLAMGIDRQPIWRTENREHYKKLEHLIEDLGLVELIQGRDNSTLDGQCEYLISKKGRELVENNQSSIELILAQEANNTDIASVLFDTTGWDEYFEERIEKRLKEADYFLDLLVSADVLKLDKTSIRKHFGKWFLEHQEFDLQMKDGDLAIEDGDLQLVPDFDKKQIAEFIKWFENNREDFISYLESEGVVINKSSIKSMNENDVFVTYSWDSKEHNDQVISFVDFLRKKGFHAEMDRSVSQNHSATDFRQMMHRAMTDYKKVIIVLSKGYREKAHAFKGGVGTEYALIIKDIEHSTNKYILVSFEEINNEIVPLGFREREILYLGNEENYNTLYAKLQDEKLIEFSEVSSSKPAIIKESIKEFPSQKPRIEFALSYNPGSSHQFSQLYTRMEYDMKLTIKNISGESIPEFSVEVLYPPHSIGSDLSVRLENGYNVFTYENQPKLFSNQSRTLELQKLIVTNKNINEIVSSEILVRVFSDLGMFEHKFQLPEILKIYWNNHHEKLDVKYFHDKYYS